ncbi:MAG: hypothetical protein Q8Q09_25020 [Deltaproteobacteria bacterium]|nr:hypothetical protein [Deltaproteobacteria bacterium]
MSPDAATDVRRDTATANDVAQDSLVITDVAADASTVEEAGSEPAPDAAMEDVASDTADAAAEDSAVDGDVDAGADAAPEDASIDAADASPMDGAIVRDAAMDVTMDALMCPGMQTRCGATCQDTRSNADHCGACDARCPAGMRTCIDGVCRPTGTCASGFGDCDRIAANGCETSLTTVSNCGACGAACVPRANTTASCAASACTYACELGSGDCDRIASNGCEASLMTATNCGRCANTCSGATALCDIGRGSCVGTCPAGTQRCGSTCVNLQGDPDNCGVCGRSCSFANAGRACNLGMCQITTCNTGFGNCDANAINGCETNLNNNIANCGACGFVCTAGPNQTASCGAGSCTRTCLAGFADCDGNATNGCEARLDSVTHCGSCGTRCAVPNAMNACSAGRCVTTGCSAGFGDCDSMSANGCESPLTSVVNCGACGRACGLANATATCATGACAIGSCAAGFADCDRIATNGCERDVSRDVNNCGGCNVRCTTPFGTPACVAGACRTGMCNAGFGDCDANPVNGCEVSITSDRRHCGACGNACAAGQGCIAGVCR